MGWVGTGLDDGGPDGWPPKGGGGARPAMEAEPRVLTMDAEAGAQMMDAYDGHCGVREQRLGVHATMVPYLWEKSSHRGCSFVLDTAAGPPVR